MEMIRTRRQILLFFSRLPRYRRYAPGRKKINAVSIKNTLAVTFEEEFNTWLKFGAMVYAMKIDNALYYEYSKMSNKEIKRVVIYVFFWFIFFIKLDEIIKGKK